MIKVTFDQFQKLNAHRSRTRFPTTNTWTMNDWLTALVGEVGELANHLKKVRRGDFPLDKEYARKELADIITYADRMMTEVGGNTNDELLTKFDEVSQRVGYTGEEAHI